MPRRPTRRHLAAATTITARAALATLIVATMLTPLVAPSVGYPTPATPSDSETRDTTTPTLPKEPSSTTQFSTSSNRTTPGDDYHPMCQHYGENGFDILESAPLFSRDRDLLKESDAWSEAEYERKCGHDARWQTNRTLEFDFTTNQAISKVDQWNRYDVEDIPFPDPRYPGMKRQAIHPEGTPTEDVGAIQDASASLYALTPSVALRDRRTQNTTFLLRGDTTIYGAQSYRIERPPGLIDDDEGRRQVDYTVTGEVLGSCVLETDHTNAAGVKRNERDATLCYQHDPLAESIGINGNFNQTQKERRYNRLDFEYTSGVADRLSYVSTFRANITRTVEYCENWNRSNSTCAGDFLTMRRNTRTYYTSAVDAFSADYYSQPSPTVEVARFPDGSTEFLLESKNPYGYPVGWEALFSEVRFESGERAGWAWRVFSARRPQWSHLMRSTATTRTLAESPTHPLQNYAVPVAASVDDSYGYGLAVSANLSVVDMPRSSPPVPTPSIDDRILIPTPQPEYRVPYAVHYRSDRALDFEDATVVGLLDGTNTTGVFVKRDVDVKQANLTTTITDADDDTLRVLVSLETRARSNGGTATQAISTANTKSYVIVNGQRVNTNASGQATVFVEKGATISAEFHPVKWTKHIRDIAYIADSTLVRTSNFGATFVLTLFTELFVIFFPFILVLVTIRSIARSNPSTPN